MSDHLDAYLRSLFEGMPGDCWIEVRIIPMGDGPARQYWHGSVDEAQAFVEANVDACRDANEGMYLGVCPRDAQKGTRDAVTHGKTLWVDLDAKDFEGGIDEALGRLEGYERKPTGLVHSGHGVHAYWVLPQWHGADEIEEANKRLAARLGGDHCHNADRILRVPGSWNTKEPDAHVQCQIVEWNKHRKYSLERFADLPEPMESASVSRDDIASVDVPDELTPFARELLRSNNRVLAHFEGRGKTVGGDTSQSGYDFTVALDVLSRGGTVEDAASAVKGRQGIAQAAGSRPKDDRYVARTVAKAANFVEDDADASPDALTFDFEWQSTVVISNADGHSVRVLVHDKQLGEDFELDFPSPSAVYSLGEFTKRYTNVTLNKPKIKGPKKGKREAWDEIVRKQLQGATRVESGDEATKRGRHKATVSRLATKASRGDCAEDLEDGAIVELDGHEHVSGGALVNKMTRVLTPRAAWLAEDLQALGYEKTRVVLPCRQGGERRVRAWRRPVAGGVS